MSTTHVYIMHILILPSQIWAKRCALYTAKHGNWICSVLEVVVDTQMPRARPGYLFSRCFESWLPPLSRKLPLQTWVLHSSLHHSPAPMSD